MTKKETIASWKEKIKTDPRWAIRAAMRIHKEQTLDEQNSHQTIESNGVGFNSHDAEIISSIVIRFNRRKFLTPGECKVLHKSMPKYAGQLYRLTQGK